MTISLEVVWKFSLSLFSVLFVLIFTACRLRLSHSSKLNGGGSTFLVDRDGTILAVRPDTEELEKILEEKLGVN